jgi:hypothetical protein
MNLKAPHLAEAGERSLWGFLFVPQGHFLAQPSAELTAYPKGISSLSLRLSSRHVARVRFWPLADPQAAKFLAHSEWAASDPKQTLTKDLSAPSVWPNWMIYVDLEIGII